MLDKPRWATFSRKIEVVCLISIFILGCALPSRADQSSIKVLCRPEFAPSRRNELAGRLRKITGWPALHFNEGGVLRLGDRKPVGGSQVAREFLAAALAGKNMIVLEDASNRQDVVFCRVVEGKWLRGAEAKPPVFILLIDFADFAHVTGDGAALAAFDVGWGVLHEVHHVVHDSVDAKTVNEAGECEGAINRMRRECGLPERAEYFFEFLPGMSGSAFKTKFVRLAFEQRKPNATKKRRYWVVWDASLTGGLEKHNQIAAIKY